MKPTTTTVATGTTEEPTQEECEDLCTDEYFECISTCKSGDHDCQSGCSSTHFDCFNSCNPGMSDF